MNATYVVASGIIIENRSVLMVRPEGKDYFIAPGGKFEKNETAIQCLQRELKEECLIEVLEEDLEYFGEYTAEAKGKPGDQVAMQAFIVKEYKGVIGPGREIAEIIAVNTDTMAKYSLGSIFKKHVIPTLYTQGLID